MSMLRTSALDREHDIAILFSQALKLETTDEATRLIDGDSPLPLLPLVMSKVTLLSMLRPTKSESKGDGITKNFKEEKFKLKQQNKQRTLTKPFAVRVVVGTTETGATHRAFFNIQTGGRANAPPVLSFAPRVKRF